MKKFASINAVKNVDALNDEELDEVNASNLPTLKRLIFRK
jgi:hypothetical protein